MARGIGRWRALANACLVLATLGLAGYGMVRVAHRRWSWQQTFRARAEFTQIGGLTAGDRVRVQGMDAGVVEQVVAPTAPGKPVTVVLRMGASLRPLVRADATAKIVTQGVVGSKVVEIVPGRPDAPTLAEGGTLRSEAPIEMADLMRNASHSLAELETVAASAREGLGEVNAIAAQIRSGKGSLGRLVQDEDAYRKLLALSDRGERTLADLEDNLDALKRTWPFSRYFNNRAYFDRDLVLFQPGSSRVTRVLPADSLFESGRSVLTVEGRRQLDQAGLWFKPLLKRNSEVVVAAFTDHAGDEDLALALTQEQANAVRKYLVSRYAIDSVGWFSSRKVAAVGFGTQAPRYITEPSGNVPARRVEIFVFTPQT
jgi:phospholipid/cholesterol/gamma-HCH transport system substrate-binding protein